MTSTELILLIGVYAFVAIAYIFGTVSSAMARDNVRRMDAEDHANERYAALIKERDEWIRRTTR